MTDQVVSLAILLLLSGFFSSAETSLFSISRSKARHLAKLGGKSNELINQMYRSILRLSVERRLKTALISHLGEADFRLSEGANSEIQMEALIANIVLSSDEMRA